MRSPNDSQDWMRRVNTKEELQVLLEQIREDLFRYEFETREIQEMVRRLSSLYAYIQENGKERAGKREKMMEELEKEAQKLDASELEALLNRLQSE